MEKQGFSKGYLWDHDEPDAFSGQEYFPDTVKDRVYYTPVERGFERELQKRLQYFLKLKEKRTSTYME
jgi:putative ATPase